MFNLNNANMENLITQINKERLVNSDTALMMKELYYYVPCEYWYDKQDRLRTDIEGRNTPMYMCECPTLAACIQWMIQTREYTFQTEQNVAVWHVVVRAGDYVLYDSESNADAFCCLEEALEKAVQLLSSDPSPAFCSAKVSGFRKWQVTAMRLYCMENNDEEVSSRHFP